MATLFTDILESRGNKELTMDGEDIGVNQFGSTLQFGGGYPLNGYEKVILNFYFMDSKLQIRILENNLRFVYNNKKKQFENMDICRI